MQYTMPGIKEDFIRSPIEHRYQVRHYATLSYQYVQFSRTRSTNFFPPTTLTLISEG